MSNGNSFASQPEDAAPWLLDVIRWPRLPGAARRLAGGFLAVPLAAGALLGGAAAAAHATPRPAVHAVADAAPYILYHA